MAIQAQSDFSVILLGTGTPIPNPDRACASTLVKAGGNHFLVDTGRGFLNRFTATGLRDVSAVFFTHYHSDHFSEFGEFMVTRSIWGAERPLRVIGPEGAGRIVGPILEAYLPDNTYRQAHHGDKWFSGGMRAQVIEALPGLVYEESGVRVTMFEVDHRPVEPAMGFRFDYAGLSVVISGDTKKVPQMVELAGNCDLLIHEAVNRDLVLMALAGLKKGNPRLAAMSEEMMEYHTSTLEVAEIARDANVGKLVLTHLVPSIPPRDDADQLFIRGMNEIYHGPIIVGRDQMEIKVAP